MLGAGPGPACQPDASARWTPGASVTSVVTQADLAVGPVASKAAAADSVAAAAAGDAVTGSTTRLEQSASAGFRSLLTIRRYTTVSAASTTPATAVMTSQGAILRRPPSEAWRDLRPPDRH